jgi:3-oxoacyl-(acyl-carrier-protein) synthase
VTGDVACVIAHATSEHDLTPAELRALAQALRDLASELCERAGRAAE